ncbi:arsenate reductase family protein [bacterium]|nr:arsenate reductase family protein [bacterium]MBU1991362.1 arsenate reductase family protein [bacterium]
MNVVIFYEKPGCVTNAKQKKLLRFAGCMVIERDVLNHQMPHDELRMFFKNKPLKEWFNPNAPLIKYNQIDLSSLSEKMAMDLLMKNPILIRRPLMVVKGRRLCGFNQWFVEKLLKVKFVRHT